MKIILKTSIALTLIVLIFSLATTAALAENAQNAQTTTVTELQNPLGQGITPAKLYGRLIFAFMGFSGVIALLMFIVGGFQWMTAGGNAEKVKKGRDTLMWAVLGLIMIFSSYAILRAIFETLRF